MVTPIANGCNVPSRPAPAPPSNTSSRRNSSLKSESDKKYGIDFSRRPFSLTTQFQSKSEYEVGRKKAPPPRPPPPKVAGNHRKQSATTILSSLFPHRNPLSKTRPTSVINTDIAKSVSSPSVPVASLIDLQSPPSSPTFTTRSSSDGVSVDSLSSDNGNTSASGNYGTSSQVESGFEDDFALFPADFDSKDSDPFSPLPKTASFNPSFNIELSNDDPKLKFKAVDLPVITNPTIIRTKQSKAPVRPPLPVFNQAFKDFSESEWTPDSSGDTPTQTWSPSFDSSFEFSPPMPSLPPPPPPIEVIEALSGGPSVPPRPSFQFVPSNGAEKEKPYCVALYDYVADHESDLSFKQNDIILLTKEVNEDWFEGSLNGHTGMFPSNHVEVKVPFGNETASSSSHQKVIAIFDFHAESWDDLDFQEGDEITVLEEINKDWLYGEIGSRKGQFPARFVSPLPYS